MLDVFYGILLFIIIILLIKPTITFIIDIYQLIRQYISQPVNLRTTYGEWAVVTGATDGVGKEYAKELVKRHINVVLISRTLEKLNNTKDVLQAIDTTVEIKIIQADFSKGKDEYEKIKTQLKDIPIGILVNNVGLLTEYPMYLEEIPEDELWNLINVNMSSTTFMTRMVIQEMKKRGKGAIVNLSSISNLSPHPLLAVYSATKVYVQYFSEAIREESSKYGVTVQCLSPFYINTNMVGFIEGLQYNFAIPDAATYAKSAIKTLGVVDSTTGYWIHEIMTFCIKLIPVQLRIKLVYFIHRSERNAYLYKRKKFS